MSHSLHVVGFKPPDEKWKKMKQVYDACVKAGVELPISVDKYFGPKVPDSSGVEVELAGFVTNHESVRDYKEDMENGFEVDLSKLPKDVTILRFFVSY